MRKAIFTAQLTREHGLNCRYMWPLILTEVDPGCSLKMAFLGGDEEGHILALVGGVLL
jgi:hypothetical protein